jgi:hypothetical protein
MNYFAHALPLLDRPYHAAGAGVPDWLTVADRRLRLRARHIEPFLSDADPITAAVAGGVSRHLGEDSRFHNTRAFAELSWQLTALTRDALCRKGTVPFSLRENRDSPQRENRDSPQISYGEEQNDRDGLRPSFLGHLLLEILLDAALIEEKPHLLQRYYRLLEEIEPDLVQEAVNRMAPRPTGRLSIMVAEFRRQRVLWDYLDDGKLLMRLNQIMRRVKLPLLPENFVDVLPSARLMVGERKDELLAGIRS